MTDEKNANQTNEKKTKERKKSIRGIAAFSLLISLFDRLGDIIYNAVINLDSNDTIDILISKLTDIGFSPDGLIDITRQNEYTLEEKILFLTSQMKKIQNLKEFVIIRDSGSLIKKGELAWWLLKALDKIRNELTIGIVSNFTVKMGRTHQNCHIENISELNATGKLQLFDKLAKKYNLSCKSNVFCVTINALGSDKLRYPYEEGLEIISISGDKNTFSYPR